MEEKCIQKTTTSNCSLGGLAQRVSRYSAAAMGGMAGTFACFESAHGALIITPSSISLTDDPLGVPDAMLDLDGDATPDIAVLVFSASFATAQGLGNASLAGTIGAAGFFYPTAFQPGSSVGSGLFFSANSGGGSNNFGTLANSIGGGGPGVGEWMGGGDAYLGARFTIGANDHYGWVHVVWDPGTDTLSIDQLAYDDSPNTAALVTPEPTSLTLLALGVLGLARRRRTC